MELFQKNKIIILRFLGGLMLLIGIASYFWTTPQKGLTSNERAAANIARMEARSNGSEIQQKKSSGSKFLDELKNKQAKQIEYLTLFALLFGVGFLAYSFIPKKED